MIFELSVKNGSRICCQTLIFFLTPIFVGLCNEAIDETDRWDHEVAPSNTGAGVPNAYRYSADYIEPTFPPKHVSTADYIINKPIWQHWWWIDE